MPNLAKELLAGERGHRRALQEAGKPQWLGVLQDAQAWTMESRVRIEAELKKIRLEYADRLGAWYPKSTPNAENPPQRDHSHNLIAGFTFIGGIFAALLETLLAGFLSSRFFNLPIWAAVLLGLGITLFFAILIMACIAALVLARYPDRSRAAARPLIWILNAALPAALILMTVFFLTRGVPSKFLLAMFGWDTALLAIDLPVVAGVLLTLHGLFNWSGEYEDEYRRVERTGSKVADLNAYCEREIKEIDAGRVRQDFTNGGLGPSNGSGDAPAGPDVHANGGGNGKALISLLVASLLFLGLSGRDARSGTPGSLPVVAELWLDDTTSVDSLDRQQTIGRLLSVIQKVSDDHGIDRWDFYGFGENSWREYPFAQSSLPHWQVPLCPSPQEEPDGWQPFKVQTDADNAQKLADCKSYRAQKHSDYQQTRERAFRGITAALDAHRPQKANCTSLGDLLKRLSSVSNARYSIIVSDGIETCRARGLPSIAAPKNGNHIVFVLTETKAIPGSLTQADQFLERQEVLLKAAPWLIVLAPASLGVDALDRTSSPT